MAILRRECRSTLRDIKAGPKPWNSPAGGPPAAENAGASADRRLLPFCRTPIAPGQTVKWRAPKPFLAGARSANEPHAATGSADVPEARRRPPPEYPRLRKPAAGQADRLSRIRCALVVRDQGLRPAARAQPDGGHRPRHGARHAARRNGRPPRDRHRSRLPGLFVGNQDGAGHRPDGIGLPRPRHRPRDDADGLFRAVRPRRAGGRPGHRLAQRERLDRGQDGLGAGRSPSAPKR